MLKKSIEEALNQQIANENYASHYYLSMASWCDKQGLRGCAKFLYGHATQELEHMMKLFHYVNDAGGHARVSPVKEVPFDFDNIESVFKLVLEHEQKITVAINELVDVCLKESDHSSNNFLQWYVAEQHEEEALFTQIIDLIRITGSDGRGLYHLDKEIGEMAGQSPEQNPDQAQQ